MAEEEGGEGSKKKTGTVKWFNGWKGFGFITPDPNPNPNPNPELEDEEASHDLFVHQTCIKYDGFRTLYDGQRVEFEVQLAEDGRSRATEVVPLGRRRRTGVVECYNCGRLGHFARDCYGGGRGGGRRGRGTRVVDCFHCGKQGHFARDCPN